MSNQVHSKQFLANSSVERSDLLAGSLISMCVSVCCLWFVGRSGGGGRFLEYHHTLYFDSSEKVIRDKTSASYERTP